MSQTDQTDSTDGRTWVSLTKASVDAGVSKSTLRKWVHGGKLDHRVVEGPSGVAWEVPMEDVAARAEARPRSAAADVGLPVLAAELAASRATFHELAEKLAAASAMAGSEAARADALAREVDRLRGEVDGRLDAERRAAVAEAEATRLRTEAAARAEAEQRAALAEVETERLRTEVATLAAVPPPKHRWWHGKRKAQ